MTEKTDGREPKVKADAEGAHGGALQGWLVVHG